MRRRVRAAGIPIALVHLVAGVDVRVGAVRLVVRIEVDAGALMKSPLL